MSGSRSRAPAPAAARIRLFAPRGAALPRPGRRGPSRLPVSGAHPHVLGALQQLALAGDLRRDHHLNLLELAEVDRAAHAEGRAKRAGEVLGAVVHARRTAEDLLQARLHTDLDPGATGQVGVG